jgi:biopolymer transport protein ExbB
LLGTVTGIINTFKLLTVFGSGDVKMLSGGISEALITTEFGLIVAIPTLLAHAFLSRRAKGITDRMEQLAIGFITELERSRAPAAPATDAGRVADGHGRESQGDACELVEEVSS